MNNVQLFELFFSIEIKKYIVEATKDNGYELDSETIDTFLGIIIFRIFNSRKSVHYYIYQTNFY